MAPSTPSSSTTPPLNSGAIPLVPREVDENAPPRHRAMKLSELIQGLRKRSNSVPMPSTAKKIEERKRKRQRIAQGLPVEHIEENREQDAQAPQQMEEEAHVQTEVITPQVRIDANGNVVIDQDSLFVSANVERREDTSTGLVVLEGTGRRVTSLTWMKREKATKWSDAETERFFESLEKYGTDFQVMEAVFPGRSRRQLKLKYKKEERGHPERVDRALRGPNGKQSLLAGQHASNREEWFGKNVDAIPVESQNTPDTSVNGGQADGENATPSNAEASVPLSAVTPAQTTPTPAVVKPVAPATTSAEPDCTNENTEREVAAENSSLDNEQGAQNGTNEIEKKPEATEDAAADIPIGDKHGSGVESTKNIVEETQSEAADVEKRISVRDAAEEKTTEGNKKDTVEASAKEDEGAQSNDEDSGSDDSSSDDSSSGESGSDDDSSSESDADEDAEENDEKVTTKDNATVKATEEDNDEEKEKSRDDGGDGADDGEQEDSSDEGGSDSDSDSDAVEGRRMKYTFAEDED